MKLVIRSILFLLILLEANISRATQSPYYYFHHISVEQGLSHPSVYCILQDKSGFMWFGTQNGLSRFDGYKFKNYSYHPMDKSALPSNWVKVLLEDKDGFLWIGTNNGLSYRSFEDGLGEKFYSFRHDNNDRSSIGDDNIWEIFEDSKGNIWVGTDKGISFLEKEKKFGGKFQNFRSNGDDNTVPRGGVNAICEDKTGRIWIGTWGGGLASYDINSKKFKTFNRRNSKIGSDYIKSMFIDNDFLWIGTNYAGLIKYDILNNKFLSEGNLNKGNDQSHWIMSVHKDSKGNIWAGSYDQGIYLLTGANSVINFKHDSQKNNNIHGNWVTSIYEDKSGMLWIGHENGLTKFNLLPPKFTFIEASESDPNKLPAKNINVITEDSKGRIWIGTWGGGLVKWNRKENKFKSYLPQDGLIDDKIWSIVENTDGKLWVGTGRGLEIFNPESNKFTHFKGDRHNNVLERNNISSLLLENETTLWIGTWGGGLAKYDIAKNELRIFRNSPEIPGSIPNDHIKYIYKDRRGIIWVATNGGGIAQIETGPNHQITFKNYQHKINDLHSISTNSANTIFEDSKGRLWIGTSGGGLNLFDRQNNQFTYFLKEDDLPDNSIEGILEDKSGNLWLSTRNGLSKFNPSRKSFKNYRVKDGLQSKIFSGVPCMLASGEMIFGGENGLNIFFPESVAESQFAAPVAITAFNIFNEPVVPGDKFEVLKKPIFLSQNITLSHQHYIFSFEFASLDYFSPEDNEYEFKMEPFDKDWVSRTSENRFATYTNLDPGTYTFKVRGTNSDGVWNPHPVTLSITITPPYWRTPWFLASISLLFVGAAFFLYMGRVSQIKKQKDSLEQQVKERTYELFENNVILEEQKREIQIINERLKGANQEINFKNKNILDSINYAKRIQQGVLPSDLQLSKILPDSFIFYKPRDIVSGDFYWGMEKNNLKFIAVADCTGHGVPGALMSMLGISFLNNVVIDNNIFSPEIILDKMSRRISNTLHQAGVEYNTNDSMDMAVCILDPATNIMQYAGAYLPLMIVRKKKGKPLMCNGSEKLPDMISEKWHLFKLQADKCSVGVIKPGHSYCLSTVQLEPNDRIYLFTDGFIDQFGGPFDKKFKSGQFKRLLLSIQDLDMADQKKRIYTIMTTWMEGQDQVDDMLVAGIKI